MFKSGLQIKSGQMRKCHLGPERRAHHRIVNINISINASFFLVTSTGCLLVLTLISTVQISSDFLKYNKGVMMLCERHLCDEEPAVRFQVFVVQSSCSRWDSHRYVTSSHCSISGLLEKIVLWCFYMDRGAEWWSFSCSVVFSRIPPWCHVQSLMHIFCSSCWLCFNKLRLEFGRIDLNAIWRLLRVRDVNL